MKYWRHSYKHGYTNASKFTWIFVKTKREKVEGKRRTYKLKKA